MKTKQIVAIAIALILTALAACSKNTAPSGESSGSEASSMSDAETPAAESAAPAPGYDAPTVDPTNMVDERFELLSLVFRLAGREEYGDADTQYQQNLAAEFEGFKNHEAVQYAADLPFGYDAVFNYSVHIVKDGDGFALISDIGSLVEDGRWTRESATEFLALLNDFYAESDFAAFYQSNIEYYKAETKRFVESQYSKIDLAWFGKYVDSNNLRCVYPLKHLQQLRRDRKRGYCVLRGYRQRRRNCPRILPQLRESDIQQVVRGKRGVQKNLRRYC